MMNLLDLADAIMNPPVPTLLEQAIEDDREACYRASEDEEGYRDYDLLDYHLDQHEEFRRSLEAGRDLAEVYASEVQRFS